MPEEPGKSNHWMPERLGRYEIVRQLGKGAMGVVFEGRDPNIGRRVAIKTARRDFLEKSGRADEMMARFLREARAAGSLSHPNIVTVYDAAEEEGVAYIAMEYLEGTDLHRLIADKRRMGVDEAVEVVATVCVALAHAHEHGVVHRDVKPSNVILLADGTPKIADFGIAYVSDSELTRDGAIMGTPYYMSPEQFMGHKVDGRADLYSLGVIAYELLTGEKPFPGEAFSTIMTTVLRGDPHAARALNYAVSEDLSQVIMKAISKDPHDRYPDGYAMAKALREAVREHPDREALGLDTGTDSSDTVETVARETADTGTGDSPADSMAKTMPTPLPFKRSSSTRRDTTPMTRAKPPTTTSVILRKAIPAAAVVAVVTVVVIGAAIAISKLAADEEPYWGEVTVTVLAYETKKAFLEEKPVQGVADITILDFDTGVAIDTYDVSEFEQRISLPADRRLKRFKYRVRADGYEVIANSEGDSPMPPEKGKNSYDITIKLARIGVLSDPSG